jgi:hypothetical protein
MIPEPSRIVCVELLGCNAMKDCKKVLPPSSVRDKDRDIQSQNTENQHKHLHYCENLKTNIMKNVNLLHKWFRCEDRTVHLQHLFFQDKETAPGIQNICFQCTSHWAKVKLPSYAYEHTRMVSC